MTDPTGTTTYGYDSLDRLNSLQDPSARVFGFGYDTLSRLTSLTRNNGVNSTFNYDNASQLLSMVHKKAAVTLASANYTYNLVGNRNTETREDAITRTFGYDGNDRMLTAISSQPANVPNENFNCDLQGNWNVNNRVHNAMDELVSDANFTYTYDLLGNLVQKVAVGNPADVTTYTYNAENRLIGVTTPTVATTYVYDPMGRRIAKTVNGVTIRYVLDGQNVLLELDGSNQVLAANTHAGLDQLLVREDQSGTHYPLSDGLNSTIALTDSSGTVTERYRYSAFGQIGVMNPDFSPKAGNTPLIAYTYTGREWEPEIGNYFHRNRFYDPALGRWLSRDPIGEDGGLNLYGYVLNNPINFVDPLGLQLNLPGITGPTLEQYQDPAFMAGYTSWEEPLWDNAFWDAYESIMDFVDPPHEGCLEASGPNPAKLARVILRIAKRARMNTMKKAYDAAKRAGKGREPVKHARDPHGPHFHPGDAKGKPLNHDHYFYPKSK